jgi:hypothetical protein
MAVGGSTATLPEARIDAASPAPGDVHNPDVFDPADLLLSLLVDRARQGRSSTLIADLEGINPFDAPAVEAALAELVQDGLVERWEHLRLGSVATLSAFTLAAHNLKLDDIGTVVSVDRRGRSDRRARPDRVVHARCGGRVDEGTIIDEHAPEPSDIARAREALPTIEPRRKPSDAGLDPRMLPVRSPLRPGRWRPFPRSTAFRSTPTPRVAWSSPGSRTPRGGSPARPPRWGRASATWIGDEAAGDPGE